MKALRLISITTALLSLLFLALFFASHYRAYYRPIPTCNEDVVLVGVGNFENGRYDNYICGPALDDFTNFTDYKTYP